MYMGIVAKDIGIDLGTATVVVTVKGKGIVSRDPCVVAMDKNTGRLLKVGMAAQRMLGRTPANIVAIRPMKDGVISDFDMTERMLREFVRKTTPFALVKPRIIVSVPSGVTEVEERAIIMAATQAGARKVYLMEEPLAAAIGAGIDISQPEGHMVIDIGGGTTDIAVVSMQGVVYASSIKTAGDEFDAAIVRYIRKKYNVLIGATTAEDIKKRIGCVYPRQEKSAIEVKGRCLLTGLPKIVTVTDEDVLAAFSEVSQRIIDAVHEVLENTPPELVADISDNGIVITGGGSLVWGIDKLIASSTNIPTFIADDPELCVAYGLNKMLDKMNELEEGTLNLSRKRQIKN